MSAPVNIVLAAVGSSAVISALDGVRGALAGMASAGLSAVTVMTTLGNVLTTGVKLNETIEQQAQAFDTLLGSATAARQRIKELYDFSAQTPFQFPEVVQASKLLQAFTKDALATGDGLRLVGDASAAVSAPLQATAMWMGRLYAALLGGQPLGEPIQNLTQLGLVSGDVRNRLIALQGQALSAAQVMAVMRDAFGFTTGAMAKQAYTLAGLKSTFSDSFAGGAAAGTTQLNEALKGMYAALTKVVSSPEFQQFVTVFGNQATSIVGGITSIAQAFTAFNPVVLGEGGLLAGSLFAASFVPKIISKLDLALVGWAMKGGDSIGSTIAAGISNRLPAGMLRPIGIGVAAVLATEVALGLYRGYAEWRAGQLDAANAGFDRVSTATKAVQSVDSDAARVAAAKQLADLEQQTAAALAVEEGRIWKNNAAIASYRQQLEQITHLQQMLGSQWGEHQMALNQAASAAERLAIARKALAAYDTAHLTLQEKQAAAQKELDAALAAQAAAKDKASVPYVAIGEPEGIAAAETNDQAAVVEAELRVKQAKEAVAKINEEVAKQDAEKARAAEAQLRAQEQLARLDEQIRDLSTSMKPLADQRVAAADALYVAESHYQTLVKTEPADSLKLKEADLERLKAKQQLLTVEEQLAQKAAEAARSALEARQLALQSQLAALNGDFTRTDADKWAERKKNLQDSAAAAREYLAAMQAQRAAATTEEGRNQADANVASAKQSLVGAENQLAGVGPDPSSWADQMISANTAAANSIGTLQQQVARGWSQSADSVRTSMGTALGDIALTSNSTGNIVKAGAWSIAQSFIRNSAQMVADWIYKHTILAAVHAIFQSGATAATAAGSATRTTIEAGATGATVALKGVEVVGHVAGETVKTAATATGSGIRIGLVIKEALASVVHGAVAAFEALASIPYVGPFLGAAAMAAALVGGMALVRSISGREQGGRVYAGTPYIVGEKRPEVFVPTQDGTIIPSLAAYGDLAGAAQASLADRAADLTAAGSPQAYGVAAAAAAQPAAGAATGRTIVNVAYFTDEPSARQWLSSKQGQRHLVRQRNQNRQDWGSAG